MAANLYDYGRAGIGRQEIDMLADDIRVALVDATYTPNLTTDEFMSSVTSAVVARSGALTTKTWSNAGVFDADDITISAVSGSVVTQVVLFNHTGSDATARLIALWTSGTGLPLTPNGGNVPVVWDSGSNKIFKL